MKTYLVSPEGIVRPDTRGDRYAVFLTMRRWTGDEWTRDIRCKFAERYIVGLSEHDFDDPDAFAVCYDPREEGPTDTTEVRRFVTVEEAEAFADAENERLGREFCENDNNFSILYLPDTIAPHCSNLICGRPHPLSRRIFVGLSCGDTVVEEPVCWGAHGVSDTWLNTRLMRDALVNLIETLVCRVKTPSKIPSDIGIKHVDPPNIEPHETRSIGN